MPTPHFLEDLIPHREMQIGDFVLFIADDLKIPTGKIVAFNQDDTVLVQELKSGFMHIVLKKHVVRIRTEFPKGPCERPMHASA